MDAELGLIYLRVPTPACAGAGSGVRSASSSLGIAIQDAMQVVRREAIGEGLRALLVVDPQEGSACPGAGRGRQG